MNPIMFAVLTFLAVLALTCLFYGLQVNWLWKGEAGNGFRYRVQVGKSQQVVEVLLAVPTRFVGEMVVRPEDFFDRFAKRYRLTTELPLGDESFDARFFLASDDPVLSAAFCNDKELEAAVSNIELLCPDNGFLMKSVQCKSQRLVLRMAPVRQLEYAGGVVFGEGMVPHLQRVARALDAIKRPLPQWHDVFLQRSVWLKSICWAMCTVTLLSGFRYVIDGFPLTVDEAALRRTTLLSWAVFMLVALLLQMLALRGSSRRHRTLAVYLGFGSWSALFLCGSLLRDVNMDFDRSGAVPKAYTVSDLREQRSPRHSSYSVSLMRPEEWAEPLTLKVDSRTYDQLKPGQTVRLQLHEGRLGFRWSDGIETDSLETASIRTD